MNWRCNTVKLGLGEIGTDLEAGGCDAKLIVVSGDGCQLFFSADPLCLVSLPSCLHVSRRVAVKQLSDTH